MVINIPSATVNASNPLKIVLDDRGKALVAIKLVIEGTGKEFYHDKTMEGPLKPRAFSLDPGTYDCNVTVGAFRSKKALGSSYDTSVTINDQVVASTKSTIPDDQASEMDYEEFTLVVTKA